MRCVILISLAALSGVQQQPPATEIYLVAWSFDKAKTVVGAVVNISNSPGYDNQPSFLPDGSGILFTSNRDGKQTDIYRYDFAAKSVTQLTHTSEGEYSPLVTPDGKSFSVIRTEADGTQRLWRFDLDGTNPRLVLENVKPVGYHVWIDATHLALFVLGGQGQPSTLQLADTTTGKAEVIDSRIGRSLHRRPGTGTISYVSQPVGRTMADQGIRSEDARDQDHGRNGRSERAGLRVGSFRPTADGERVEDLRLVGR